ncbi:MAG: RepB family plasmid replication initiator protein [Pedobacter sp.]|nr:MAG: RepB family plasmid replication initiator protein [Pedobacter sp.]
MSVTSDSSTSVPALFSKRSTNYQPNFFTESRQEFTELEKNIVTLVINQIGHMALKGEIKPDTNIRFQIPYAELTTKRYDQIANAAETLQFKRISYRNDKTEKFHFIVPFPSIKSDIVAGKKVIELTMFADVVPHFSELGKRYTKYECDIMLSLSSVYAKRMFDIVSMYQCRGQYRFTYQVDQLMVMLNCPEGYTFNDFKKNALWVAQRQLLEKANIVLEWEPTKKIGKNIVELDFIIQTQLQIASEAVKQDQQVINKMSINEAVTTAWQLLKSYKLKSWQKDRIISDHSLLETFFRVDSELANGLRTNVKNPTAYLVKSLGIDKEKAPQKLKPQKTPQSVVSAPTLFPQGPTLRSGSVKSIGAIFGDMIMNE